MNIYVWWVAIPGVTFLITLVSLGVMAFLQKKYTEWDVMEFREKAQYVILAFNIIALVLVLISNCDWLIFLFIALPVLGFAWYCYFILRINEPHVSFFLDLIALVFVGVLLVGLGSITINYVFYPVS